MRQYILPIGSIYVLALSIHFRPYLDQRILKGILKEQILKERNHFYIVFRNAKFLSKGKETIIVQNIGNNNIRSNLREIISALPLLLCMLMFLYLFLHFKQLKISIPLFRNPIFFHYSPYLISAGFFILLICIPFPNSSYYFFT